MRLTCLAVSFAITGCASPVAYQQHRQALATLEQFNAAETFLDLDLVDQAGMAEDKRRELITGFMPKVEQCGQAATAQMETMGQRYAVMGDAAEAMRTSRQIDESFDACVRAFGVTGHVEFKVGERYLRLPAFVQGKLHAAQVASVTQANVAEQENESGTTWAVGSMMFGRSLSSAYANQGSVYVSPHVRSNGAFVNGHYRSAPDGLCFNNKAGCR